MGIGLPTREECYADGVADGRETERREAKTRDLEWAKWLAGRIAEGKCALVGGWCVVHNTEDNPGHAFEKGGLSTLD
jgi:hypothetical protein